jgi:hypothetical protein
MSDNKIQGPSRWSDKEVKKLIKLYRAGKNYDEIGKIMSRSDNAIKMRIEMIVYNNLVKGKSINSISKDLNSTKDKIVQMYYSYKSFLESKGKDVIDIDLYNNNKNISSNNSNNEEINIIKKLERENMIMDLIIKNISLRNSIKKKVKGRSAINKVYKDLLKSFN